MIRSTTAVGEFGKMVLRAQDAAGELAVEIVYERAGASQGEPER